jgi:hypothetical protein
MPFISFMLALKKEKILKKRLVCVAANYKEKIFV